jgi:NAD(P)H-nitrite reductase large subunit
MRIVIVGNGPAALSAVEAIRETDQACDVTILTPEADRAYTPCFLGRYVAGRIDAGALAVRSDDFYETHHVELLAGRAVSTVLPDESAVLLDDGTRVAYDRLLLACGADPIVPGSPDLSGVGVFYFRSLGDANAIRARAERAHDVVVLGSGFVAMEIAEALTEAGASVAMVARTDHILRRIFDPEVGDMVEAHMSANGVRFMKCCDLVEVERDADSGEIRAAVLSSGERVPCDMLVVGVGMRPDIAIVAGTSIATAGGILTDDAMRTSVPNVYAAGDVAEAEIGGVRKVNLIHPNATAGGRVAGRNMAGGDEHMSSHLADMNVLTVFGRSFLAVGALEGEKVLKRAVGGDFVKVFADAGGVIMGVELVGDVTRGGLFASLIARHMSVGDVPELLTPGFNYGQTVGPTARVS